MSDGTISNAYGFTPDELVVLGGKTNIKGYFSFQGLQAMIDEDPLVKAIAEDRIYQIGKIPSYAGYKIEPVEVECKGYAVVGDVHATTSKEELEKVYLETKRLMDEALKGSSLDIDVIMAGDIMKDPKTTLEPVIGDLIDKFVNYERDPFWTQYQQLKAQMKNTEWKQPIFLEEGDEEDEDGEFDMCPCGCEDRQMAMSESEMDWDEDEQDTTPGLAPASPPPEPKLEATPDGASYPQITTEGIAKGDCCYLCATKKLILRFKRQPGDWCVYCVKCLYDHIGWELLPTGALRKVVPDF